MAVSRVAIFAGLSITTILRYLGQPKLFVFRASVLGLGMGVLFSGCAVMVSKPLAEISLTEEEKHEKAQLAFLAGQTADQNQAYQSAVEYYHKALAFDPDSITLRRYLVNDLILLQRFPEAIQEYHLLAKKSPQDTKNNFVLGQLYEAAGNTPEAEKRYLQAIKLGEEKSRPLTKLGALYLKQERFSEALAWLQPALNLDPNDRDARRLLIKYWINQGRESKAEALLRAALLQAPEDIEWLADLGSVLATYSQRQNEAAEIFQRLVKAHPDYPEGPRYLAQYYLKRHDWEAAAEQLERLLKLEPRNLSAKRDIGRAYYELGNFSQARQVLLELIESGDADAFSRYLMGIIYQKNAHSYLAANEYRTALRLDPQLTAAYLGLAEILTDAGELENAAALLENAQARCPDIPQLAISYGVVMLRLHRPQAARAAFLKALRTLPSDAGLYFYLGQAFQQLDDLKTAVNYWKQAVQIDPRFAEAYNYLAYSYAERGFQLEQALRWIRKALALDPRNGYYFDTLGWIYYQQKKFVLAQETLLKARDFFLTKQKLVDPSIYDHLGDVYHRLKNYSQAMQSWKLALEGDPKNAAIQKKLGTINTSTGKAKP